MNKLNRPLRVIFAGTPEFALPPLQALIDEGCDLVAVLTQPDRPAGRGKHLRASPVKQLALENGLEVLQPESLKANGWLDKLADLQPDLMIVVAYGLMIPTRLLDLPRLGCWNIHASLLPRWRGAAPIHRAIEAGDEQTGVCIMKVEPTLDTGPVYHCLSTPVGLLDTAEALHDRLAAMGAQALKHCIKLAINDELPQPQAQNDAEAVYARKLSKAEAELDWNEPAEVLQRKVRAFNPWPVAQAQYEDKSLRIWGARAIDCTGGLPGAVVAAGKQGIDVACGEGCLRLLEIQLPGGKRLDAAAFLNARDVAGLTLG